MIGASRLSKLSRRDYYMELANTGYGDMLHDEERNEKYDLALTKEIARLHLMDKKAHVLDIGTGTGLLAMMAARAGADTVHACERFRPMADCAEQVIRQNGYMHRIVLIKKSSEQIVIGEDMPHRANILVAELLDSELIGEGALDIYNHAHEHLLTDDAICIPGMAICFAQLASSRLATDMFRHNDLHSISGDDVLQALPNIETCPGVMSLNDFHLDRVPADMMDIRTPPLAIFNFDFTSKTKLTLSESLAIIIRPTESDYPIDCVVFWWDILLDTDFTIKLSCAPKWAREDKVNIPWREHWLQVLFFLPEPVECDEDDPRDVRLICTHDKYSFWFHCMDAEQTRQPTRPVCVCDFHTHFSKNRIGVLNDSARNAKYVDFIEHRYMPLNTTEPCTILVIGDFCMLGLLMSMRNCVVKVYCFDRKLLVRQLISDMVILNKLDNVEILEEPPIKALTEEQLMDVTHVFGEPFFIDARTPMDNLFDFCIILNNLMDSLDHTVKIAPYAVRIYALPMQFKHLHKLYEPVRWTQGFNMESFDIMVKVTTTTTIYAHIFGRFKI